MPVNAELLHVDRPQALAVRAALPDLGAAERLSGPLRALGDPTRLRLAAALADGRELCVCDLSWITQRPANLTSHHMKVLKAHGVVHARRDGKMTLYRLSSAGSRLLGAAL